MRLALQRLLANPSALSILRNAVKSGGASFCPYHSASARSWGQSRGHAAKEKGREQLPEAETRAFQIRKHPVVIEDERYVKAAIEHSRLATLKLHARLPYARKFEGVEGAGLSRLTVRPDVRMVSVTQDDVHSDNPSSRTQLRLPIKVEWKNESWRNRLATFEQYQYESDLESPALQGPRLVDDPLNTKGYGLWLELIIFRNRHHGAEGTMAIYKEIFRRGLRLPTRGIVADQLWDLLIRAGFYDSRFLEEVVSYAIRLERFTRRVWLGLYCGVMSIALKKDPDSAYSWHLKLRDAFPPSLGDYQKLFKLSFHWGSSAHLRRLYRDLPLLGMYRTVIWPLCESQIYDEALKWHDLLFDAKDFPARFSDIRPLLDHLAYIRDGHRLENIVKALTEAKIGISSVAENFVRKDAAISREIMNRKLGEIHGVGAKHLSDGFCARLFATRLFSIETIINGLRMVAVEAIGPLSLREMAVRDDCDPGAICDHADRLKNAGISLDSSVFCHLVRTLALENKRGILKSIVDSDLHPDTFADYDLQERLLAQYYEGNDLAKIERTLAIFTTGLPVKSLQTVRTNLILRCQVTLGRRERVLATLGQMKHMGIPVSARSSRHLRVCWISRRQVRRGADQIHELGILIKASQMTMQSGGFVPIIAWREIMRRLGMAGRLMEFENLALWLVDWYLSPAAKAAVLKRVLLSGHSGQALIKGHVSPDDSPNRNPSRILNTLFTTAARHAIVAWGFQHFMPSRRNIRRFKTSTGENLPRFRRTPQFQWTWGLHLLHKLRERGMHIRKSQVARICRHRLNTLFGIGRSKRNINRRARSEQSALDSYTESVYIRKMEAIWGEDLFQVRVWRRVGTNLEQRRGRKPQKIWLARRKRHRKGVDAISVV